MWKRRRLTRSTRISPTDLPRDLRECQHDALELPRMLVGGQERPLHLKFFGFGKQGRTPLQQLDQESR